MTNGILDAPVINQLIHSAIDRLNDGVLICTPVKDDEGQITDFAIQYINDSLARKSGSSAEMMTGLRWSELIADHKNRPVFQICCEVFEKGSLKAFNSAYAKDIVKNLAAEDYFEVTAAGFGEGIIITLHEITESKNIELGYKKTAADFETESVRLNELLQENIQINEALSETISIRARERELFEGIFNSIPVMITIYDPDFQQFRFNNEFKSKLGWTEKHASDGNFMERVYPDPAYREEVSRFMQSLEPGWREFSVTAKDGSLVESSWSNIRLSNNISIGIGIDIRQMKKALLELSRSNKELEQFAYIASHDLQEPLRMISNFSRLLEKKYKNQIDETANLYIEYISNGTKRMQSLIRDLLIYARVRKDENSLSDVVLDETINGIIADLKAVIEENSASVIYAGLPKIKADQGQIRQLFQNLISNAIKFKGAEPPLITVEAKRSSREWIFAVKDNGIGIAPEYHEKIFTIFQRLHTPEEYAGTGIGLSICKKIVDQHGGRIWVESEEGRGAAFYFTLPRTLNHEPLYTGYNKT